jgi:hypothetical protein
MKKRMDNLARLRFYRFPVTFPDSEKLLGGLDIKPDHELWVVEELGKSLLGWVTELDWASLTVEAHAPPHSGA